MRLTPQQQLTSFERQLTYRILEYVGGGRGTVEEFTIVGLRDWMLSQKWPDSPPSERVEYLTVLSWAAICSIERNPEREESRKHELRLQLEYLDGVSDRRPNSYDKLLSTAHRANAYASLLSAAAPGSAIRANLGMPRFKI